MPGHGELRRKFPIPPSLVWYYCRTLGISTHPVASGRSASDCTCFKSTAPVFSKYFFRWIIELTKLQFIPINSQCVGVYMTGFLQKFFE